ncbi:MAG: DUF2802 domain-containing protein [Chromatiaceae bacterium]|jgi:hypothetical protein|nr:DUF2802 domain-containing protein [Hydrogenophilales bacterium]MBP6582637.1 DUF2802 domain-containing protein [Chromatiaceae bacterium]MBP6807151.1 DUF2802 domain-containing protein [Chromatiaceae bacterium]
MLENLVFTGRELLLAVVLATAVYLLEVLIFSRRRKTERNDGLASRMGDMEREMAVLKSRLDAMELRPPADSSLDTQKSLHAEAIRMARNGAQAQELVDQLGISLTEADLIVALQKSEP